MEVKIKEKIIEMLDDIVDKEKIQVIIIKNEMNVVERIEEDIMVI